MSLGKKVISSLQPEQKKKKREKIITLKMILDTVDANANRHTEVPMNTLSCVFLELKGLDSECPGRQDYQYAQQNPEHDTGGST